jgi:hypothetical protein
MFCILKTNEPIFRSYEEHGLLWYVHQSEFTGWVHELPRDVWGLCFPCPKRKMNGNCRMGPLEEGSRNVHNCATKSQEASGPHHHFRFFDFPIACMGLHTSVIHDQGLKHKCWKYINDGR